VLRQRVARAAPLRHLRPFELAVQLVDIAANLTSNQFASDRDAVIARALAAGVERMVVLGLNVPDVEAAIELVRRHPEHLVATAGVHPHSAGEFGPDDVAALRAMCDLPEIVAVGECGLDHNRMWSDAASQAACLEAHVELAIETGLPLFLHEREARVPLLEILAPRRAELGNVVVHCFTGSREDLVAYLDLDLHVGITGWICDERRGAHLHDIVGLIPAERLMVETDAPYLLPRSLRPKPETRRNEPMHLPEVVRTIATATGREPADVAASSTAVARRFFRFDRRAGRTEAPV
jgi:TatD DNase family protein